MTKKPRNLQCSGLVTSLVVAGVTAWLAVGCSGPGKGGGTSSSGVVSSFFVGTNGNDGWSGRLASPNRAGTDGPFRTVDRALRAARVERAQRSTGATSPVGIVLRGGTHFLSVPIVLTPEDSDLRIMAYRGEQPVISGGRPIGAWKVDHRAGREVWLAEVPEARGGKWVFRELWVNCKRATRARYPNKGYLEVSKLLDKASDWTQGHSRFEYKAGDLSVTPTITNAEVMVMTRWVESRLPVTGIDPENRIIRFGKRSVFELAAGDLYYIEGAPEYLDVPGEWYLDDERGELQYVPLLGQVPSQTVAVAPVLPQVLRFEGDPQGQRFVERVAFDGITFSHTEWCFPEGFQSGKHAPTISPEPSREVGGFAQAAIGVPGAVWGEGVRKCSFRNCRFVNLGTYGMELVTACTDNQIIGCEFAHLGAGGLKIGQTGIPAKPELLTQGNVVSDCRIFDGGLMFHSAIGIWLGQTPGNRIEHNLICDFYYTGISVGWTWGYGTALATNNMIAFNHVHHIGVRSDGDGPILSDMAGIYTLGRHIGTTINNNLWHDVAGIRYGGWGIYFDEGTTGIRAVSNVVYRTTHGGFHQHYGATNVVQNNIFAFARDYQVQRSRVEPHLSFSFQTNVVYFRDGVLFGGNWAEDKFAVDWNVYYDARAGANAEAMKVGAGTWPKWLERGHDQHSVVADPLFMNLEQDDFRLKEGSPALRLGFRPIDLRGVGPRKL